MLIIKNSNIYKKNCNNLILYDEIKHFWLTFLKLAIGRSW